MRFLTASASLLALSVTACAQEASNGVSAADKAAIEEIVHAYILENPEIVEAALIQLGEQREAEEEERARQAILAQADAIYNDPRDFSIGPADAPVTVVEFFDYRCGFCKASVEWVTALPAKHDGQVRVIFKEFPILSTESREAALAALAAGEQGKYVEMHRALMQSPSKLSDDDIEEIAESVGVDIAKLRADAKSTDVQRHVADVRALAEATGTRATPTFIINGEVVSGFDRSRLEAVIDSKLSEVG
ncbi:MAG: DsbA family protein [Pseudomonadota bacterium]